MLPDGFHFEDYVGGPGLYLGDRLVATTCPANYDPNPPWRTCTFPSGLPRYVFHGTEEQAVRYMTAWAVKWEAQIREASRNAGDPFAHLMIARGRTIHITRTRWYRSSKTPRSVATPGPRPFHVRRLIAKIDSIDMRVSDVVIASAERSCDAQERRIQSGSPTSLPGKA